MKPAIKLVIFDCDGVLVDSEPVANKVFSEYLISCDIPISPEDVTRKFVGRSLSSCKSILETEGWTVPDTFIDDIREQNLEALSRDLDPIPGIHAALDKIMLPVCVASSGLPVKINQSLSLTNLASYFGPHIFSAQHVSNGKPAPDLFLHAAKTMGVAPENTFVIEDSPVGVQAGVAAGMQVVGFSGGGHTEPGHDEMLQELGAHHVLDTMLELPDLIERYNG
jgi:HAD superfamily hydrolase (TIGR01509 family)